MFPPHIGAPGLCDVQGVRLQAEYRRPLPAPQPTRHPLPAHTRTSDVRPGLMNFPLNAVNTGFHPLPVLSLPSVQNPASAVAIPTPLLPDPTMPFGPFSFGSQAQELQNLNLIHSLSRANSGAVETQKLKTPINRNYLELAMLVCNTFRGKLFPCPHCRYVTDRRNNLKRHISTMHQTCDKLLECCGVSFSTKASLREHIMIFHHNGYSCPYCGRRFCRKALLKRHLSVHSGQKDYTCPSCDYATSHKSNLERHKRIHERLKLGEEGSIFGCTDFSSHQTQSPDTTDNSFSEADSKADNCVDLDTSDECSSDIDVTEDSFDEENKLSNYPVYIPRPTSCDTDTNGLYKRNIPYGENSDKNQEPIKQSVDLCRKHDATRRKIETVTKTYLDQNSCEPLDLQVTSNVH
ncbi:zinc finger protein 90 homolog [Mercenaria mercenaria]|uniref:zinc finger protein 90 homolog n=1 Tax=Mercenaria mercenaria TaxID=6596 RepID=UPI00234F7BD8|nr:zinc finger protein 90 homolog [Mercenaria mercenaria]